MSFIDRYIRGLFSSARKILLWYSLSVKFLSRNSNAADQLHLSETNWTTTPEATIRVARRPQSETFVSGNSSASGLCQLKPASLGPDFQILHAAPDII